MTRLINLIVVILTVTGTGFKVEAGRLVQEDPSWNKDEMNKEPLFLVPDAPDDDFVLNGLREVRGQQIGPLPKISSTTSPAPIESTKKPLDKRMISTTTTPMPSVNEVTTKRKKRLYISSSSSEEPLNKRIRKRIDKSEIENHRFMSSGSSAQDKDKAEISKQLDQKILEEEGGGDEEGEARRKRQNYVQEWEKYPPHELPLDSYFFKFNLTTPKYPYSKCWVSLGYKLNPRCLGGEVCVDKDTGLEVECSLPAPAVCPPCPGGGGGTPGPPGPGPPPPGPGPTPAPGTPGPPAQACPKGCAPGKDCPDPAGEEDGVCGDPVRPTEEYDYSYELSSTHRTPQVFYTGSVAKGDACSVYGDLIDENEKSDLDFQEKSKKLKTNSETGNLGSSICNWSKARLECIPNSPRISTTTPAGAPPPTDADIEAAKRPAGTCQCMIALGENAVVVPEKNTEREICYIPANKGIYSACDHDIIFPPYGALEGLRRNGLPFIKGQEPAGKYCVPNAECRAGYKYTGLRCMCKKKSRWDARTFSCSKTAKLGNFGGVMGIALGGLIFLGGNL